MSAFLEAIGAREIDPVAEYGYASRTFDRRPCVRQCDDYASCFVVTYRTLARLPPRLPSYRNHFALFRHDRGIMIVRTETTLRHTDNDVILVYDVIDVSNDEQQRFVARNAPWHVSFDRDIAYSASKPQNVHEYELLASGEWWYFDKGVVLNGVTRYEKNEPCESLLSYYELHPRYRIPRTGQRTTLGTLRANLVTGVVRANARPMIRENDLAEKLAPKVQMQAVIPSLFWFNERKRELDNGDISYFSPRNAPCLIDGDYDARLIPRFYARSR